MYVGLQVVLIRPAKGVNYGPSWYGEGFRLPLDTPKHWESIMIDDMCLELILESNANEGAAR
jgi:hypothetical protein